MQNTDNVIFNYMSATGQCLNALKRAGVVPYDDMDKQEIAEAIIMEHMANLIQPLDDEVYSEQRTFTARSD